MLGRPRTGAAQAALNDALALLAGLFHGAGHEPLAPPYLSPAERLLDVYGEDLRARAFIFADPERGNELCLRPDFTGPVALAHGAGGWDRRAAYAYQGPVFRNQPPGLGRPVEYSQAGVERFGDADAARADAIIFALLHRGLAALGIGRPVATIGDLSIPFALLDALEMPARRRAALRRHFWRPARFQALLERAQTPPRPSPERQALIAAVGGSHPRRAVASLMMAAGEPVGIRQPDEIAARAEMLAAQAADPPMPAADAALIGELLAISGPALEAPARLRRLTEAAGLDLSATLERFEARLAAIEAEGVATVNLHYDAAFGRNLEYYDGFVFELNAPGDTSHPPLAGGGRYDAMTARLGADAPVPAVGGMIRPEAVLEARA